MRIKGLLVIVLMILSALGIPSAPVIATSSTPAVNFQTGPIEDMKEPTTPPTPKYLVTINALTQELSISNYTISKEGIYDVIHVPGFDNYVLPGAPAIPKKVYTIVLPPNADLNSVKLSIIEDTPITLPGEYNIKPAPPVVTAGPDGTVTVLSPGQEVYRNETIFPKTPVKLVHVGQERQIKVAMVEYYPFQYSPGDGKLVLHDNVVIMLQWKPTTENLVITDPTSAEYLGSIKQEALNSRNVDGWYFISTEALPSETPSGYAIITTNAIVQNSARLSQYVQYLQDQGFNVYVITEDQYGYEEGQQRAINIRNWLKNNYETLNIKYVLLIGNPDPDDPSDPQDSYGDVPMLMAWPNASSDHRESPTDYFYADLTGNWDLDGDGYYAEYPDDFGTGGVDLLPEVYVGRIPVYNNDYSTLDAVLVRLMATGSSPKKILLPMAISNYQNEDGSGWPVTDGRDLPMYVGQDAEPLGFQVVAMYEGEGLAPVPSDAAYYAMNINGNNFVSEWNSGNYGIVLWWAHGSSYGAYRKVWTSDDGDNVPEGPEMSWYSFVDINTVTQLYEMPTFVFQVSCLNGYPEYSDNLQYTLFKSAALATIAASRVSWYIVGIWAPQDSYPDNAGLGYYFVKNLVNGMSAGEALYTAKAKFTASSGSAAMNLFDFNLYGDPSRALEGNIPPRTGQTIYVDDDLKDFPQANYTKISDALNAAFPGDTIVVYPGTYMENVKIDVEGIVLKAASPEKTVIIGDGSTGTTVEITTQNVVFEGFTVNNTPSGNYDALKIEYASGVIINNVTTTKLNIRYSSTITVNNTRILAPTSWNPLDIWSSRDIKITNTDVVPAESAMAIGIGDSVNVNLTNVNIERGRGIDLYGWEMDHYSTHVMDSVLVDGYPVAYFANKRGWSISDQAVAQMVIANCSDFTITNTNVTKYRTIIAYSNNVAFTGSQLSASWQDVELRYSSYVTIENSIVGYRISFYGNTLDHFVTHTISNVTDSSGKPILQIKDITGPTTITPGEARQLIVTGVSNADINIKRQYIDDVLIAGSQDVTFRNTSSYTPSEIWIKLSSGITVKDIAYTWNIRVEDSTGITLENTTAGYMSIWGSNENAAKSKSYIVGSRISDLTIGNDDGFIVYNNTLGEIHIYSNNIRIYQNNIFPQWDHQKDDTALYISGSNVTIDSNIVHGFAKGIQVQSWSGNVFVYNNVFNNTENFVSTGAVVYLNVTKTPGKNVLGGPYLGGNYWASPDGNGFSDTCTDANWDGICDQQYQVDSYNTDYLPLAIPPKLKDPEWVISLNSDVTAYSKAEYVPVYAVGTADGKLVVISPWKSAKVAWTADLDGSVTAIKVNKYGNYIVAGTSSGKLYYFMISSSTPRFVVDLDSAVRLVDISGAEGKSIIAYTDGGKLYYIYKLSANKIRFTLQPNSPVTVAKLSEDGTVIILGTASGEVHYIYTVYGGVISRSWDVGSAVTTISGVPSYEWFTVGTSNGDVYYINRWLGQTYVKLLGSFGSSITALDVAPAFTGTRIAVGTANGEVHYIDKSADTTVKLGTLDSQIVSVDLDATTDFVTVGTPSGVYYIDRVSSRPLWVHVASIAGASMGPEGYTIFAVSPSGDVMYFVR
ncbi:NosD domain-containing protein [Thermococcus sp. MV11]|uniref:NosD domain-containing protein n=1 Tax=Thermococcus sp. MV11 TaxID=1638267 RepID=UPI0014322408|nr:NosD domain-containing protein [Thermococcus sp. MV11]NJE03851.1 hypothetical protein [Thermococcus sp. MV11]